ncbi:hypothetical protein WA026_006341 [Henosepilachna vigintioctopunctata]|uniref:Peptidase M13 N-terminal domain-containing protein n=1 Tax=Henosepilachna vigintioctopunctata TaxID=420089 RepID=A0AAW1TNK5_9CUCU
MSQISCKFEIFLDTSVDPCDDFYKYTCGHWSEEHPNHGWYTSFSSFTAVNERIIVASFNFLKSNDNNETLPVVQSRMLYRSCVDQESADKLGFTTIFDYLEKVGLPKIPALLSSLQDDEKSNFQVNWLKIEANIKKTFSKDVFFGFSVDVNNFQVSENIMYIGTPGNVCPLPSPFRKLKEEDGFELKETDETAAHTEKKELRSIIRSKIVKFVISELLKNLNSEVPSEELLEQAAFAINNMTNTIEEFTKNFTSSTDAIATAYTFKELQSEIDQFTTDNINQNKSDFLETYIELIFSDIVNVTIDFQQDKLHLTEEEKPYLFHIMTYLLSSSDIYIELYLWWSTVFSMIMNTTTEVIEFIVKETEILYTSTETISRSRSVECVDLVNTFMGIAVTYGIADKTFANTSGVQVRNMLDDIREAFRSSVERLTWMDEATKRATLEKSKNMYSLLDFQVGCSKKET